MKKAYFLFFMMLFFVAGVSSAQSKLGNVAVVYITTGNLDSSVVFYEKLGFAKTGSNEYPSPWAQVSDGSLLIMMRKDDKPYIGLTYYVNDLDKTVAQLEKDSIVFDKKPNADDPIKRYYIKSPDGFNIVLVNNLGNFKQPTGINLITMKPADFNAADKYPNSQCGAFGEFAQPVTDINRSVAFWKKLGFKASAEMKEPYPHVILTDGLMIIGLHQAKHFTFPVVTYFGINTAQRIQQLKDKGLHNFSNMMGPNNVDLKTWEGQHFFIFSMGM
ncbi:MAG: VOC family protein [Ferruginibacter sp.]